jgi:hypothetical protein
MNEENNDFLKGIDKEFKLNELFETHKIQYISSDEIREMDLWFDEVNVESRHMSGHNRPWSITMDSEIDRLIKEFDIQKVSSENGKRESIIDKLRALSGRTETIKEQRKQILKSGFLNMLRDKIDFDDDGNLIDVNGTIMRSTGQVGLMFVRILNEMLENKKNPDQIEQDLKEIFK